MGERKIKQRRVKFEGRLYKARPDRGPLNKDFTVDDLRVMAPTLKGSPVWYDHGDREDIKQTRVGKIRKAHVDSEDHLCVKGRIVKAEKLGPQLHERIRTELITGKLPQLSMHWCAPAQNQTTDETKRIAVADKRWMKEISLVPKGLYPEANIVAVAASDSVHTAWKVVSGLLTSEALKTSTVANTRPMSAASERHGALLKYAKDVMTPEDRKRWETDPQYQLEIYEASFEQVYGKNEGYEKKEKRERDAYTTKEIADAEQIAKKMSAHWTAPGAAELMTKDLMKMAKDFDNKDVWHHHKEVYSKYPELHTEVGVLKKGAEGIIQKAEVKSEEVAVAASETRNIPKKAVIAQSQSFHDRLKNALHNAN